MKTKLLKKVRKRFEINYYPHGYNFGDVFTTNHSCMAVIDKSPWTYNPVKYQRNEWESKENAYLECYERLLKIILTLYGSYGTRRNKKPKKITEKLWYNGRK